MLSLLPLSRGTESSGGRRIARATRGGRRLTRPCGRCLLDLYRIRQAVHYLFPLLKKFQTGNGRRYAPRAACAAPRLSPPLLFDSKQFNARRLYKIGAPLAVGPHQEPARSRRRRPARHNPPLLHARVERRTPPGRGILPPRRRPKTALHKS